MNYEETVSAEIDINIKNQADKIYVDFIGNVQLKLDNYMGNGKFKIWSDSNTSKYVIVHQSHLEYVCNFLHENYSVIVTPAKIFDAIKSEYRGVKHLQTDSLRG
jgi:hypothetical protein